MSLFGAKTGPPILGTRACDSTSGLGFRVEGYTRCLKFGRKGARGIPEAREEMGNYAQGFLYSDAQVLLFA